MSNQDAASKGLDPATASGSISLKAQAVDKDRMLSIVFEIAKTLATEQDLEAIVTRVLSSIIEIAGVADAGIVLLYDSSDGWLKVEAAQGYDLSILKQVRLASGESMIGKVFQTGQAELYSTPEAVVAAMANMTPSNHEIFRKATIGLGQPLSAVCIPLTVDQTRIGVLVLENLCQSTKFTSTDLDFLQGVADLIALSITNCRLREERQSAQVLSEANRLKAELISTLAHEMRTPLTSIRGYSTALLMEEATFSPEVQREFLQIIDEEGQVRFFL
ncbi:MAG: GAF domain-containing protein [Chloroflexi bacterium]|nr:GAF domain-containing protein [Chloroflexota bacterium]